MIHIAVLAGGQSRRMGRDKALLPLGDQTLIERVIAAARPLAYPRVIVGDPATYAHLGLPVLPDRRPGLGPLGGLHTALGQTAAPVLLLACDLPFLTADFLGYLVNRRGPHQAVVPYTAAGLQPLCALYEPSCLAAIEAAIQADQLGMRNLLHNLNLDLVREKDWRPERGAFCQSQRARRVRAGTSRTSKSRHPPHSTPTIAAGRGPKP